MSYVASTRTALFAGEKYMKPEAMLETSKSLHGVKAVLTTVNRHVLRHDKTIATLIVMILVKSVAIVLSCRNKRSEKGEENAYTTCAECNWPGRQH